MATNNLKDEYTFTFKCGNRIWWKIVAKLDSKTITDDNEDYCWSVVLSADEREVIDGGYIYTNVPWVDKRDCARWIQSFFGNLAITCAADSVEIG